VVVVVEHMLAARLAQVVLEVVVMVKQTLALPHKTELQILEVVVEAVDQTLVFQAKHQAQAAPAWSSSKFPIPAQQPSLVV
jgi:hypothetical protein